MSREEANRIVRAAERARRMRHAGLKLALPTAAALGAGAAFAIGAIPGGDGTITGCYVTNTDVVPGASRYGELRVIDPSQPATLPSGGPNEQAVCFNGEQTITWNQRGPQGPQGPQGPAGSAGAPGANGRDLIGSTTFGFDGTGGTFLKLDGIAGEATQKDHKDWIDLSSFSLGGGTARSSGGGGGSGAGKTTISSFTITKTLDKSSPLLFQAAVSGKHFKLANVSFAKKTRGKVRDYLVFKFDTVFVSSIQQGSGGGGGAAKEAVTFSFQKATESFLGPNGRPIQSVTINVGVDKKA